MQVSGRTLMSSFCLQVRDTHWRGSVISEPAPNKRSLKRSTALLCRLRRPTVANCTHLSIHNDFTAQSKSWSAGWEVSCRWILALARPVRAAEAASMRRQGDLDCKACHPLGKSGFWIGCIDSLPLQREQYSWSPQTTKARWSASGVADTCRS